LAVLPVKSDTIVERIKISQTEFLFEYGSRDHPEEFDVSGINI
jgi:hypothetical protein